MQSASAPLAIRALALAPSMGAALPALSHAATRFASNGAFSVFVNESSTVSYTSKNPIPQVCICILF